MYLPMIKNNRQKATAVSENFGGLNRSDTIADNEFEDMKNCGNMHFPFISKREPRLIKESYDEEISHVFAPVDDIDDSVSFTGISGNVFYYKGKKQSTNFTYERNKLPYPYSDKNLYPLIHSEMAKKEIAAAPFGNFICFYPSATSFSTLGEGAGISAGIFNYVKTYTGNDLYFVGYSSNSFAITRKSYMDVSNIRVGDRVNISYSTKFKRNNCTVNADSPIVKKILLENYDKAYVYDSTNGYCYGADSEPIVTAIVTQVSSGTNFSEIRFKLYDIKGNLTAFVDPQNDNCQNLYYKSNSSYSGINEYSYTHPCFGYTSAGYPYTNSGTITISKYVPDIKYVCEFAGRMFGLDYYGNYIYASKLNEPLNFTTYDGLSDSSWYTEINSSGEWTGICACGSYLYCFKKDRVYVLYGDNSKNFTVAKSFSPGCTSAKSICVVNNFLYYMASDGIYCYNAGVPSKISDKLGEFKYTDAVCHGFGSLLYCCLKTDEKSELFVFDTEKNIWYRHDEIDIVGFYVYKNKLFGATKHDFICFGDGCEDFEYSVTSKIFTDATSYMRSIVSLYFRMKLSAGSEATVFVSYDGGEWNKCGFVQNGKLYDTNSSKSVSEFTGVYEEGKAHRSDIIYSQRVPVRFRAANTYQYKIVCHGNVIIEAIERDIGINGRARR